MVVSGAVLLASLTFIAAVATHTAEAETKATVHPFIASQPLEKQSYAARGEATKEGLRRTPYPEPQPILARETVAPLQLGILDNQYLNPWHPKQSAENLWRGYIGGELVTVWAGNIVNVSGNGKTESTPQGYVGVAVGTKLGADADYHEYLTPTQHGAVKITAVNGMRVSLTTQDGTSFVFDLTTQTFV